MVVFLILAVLAVVLVVFVMNTQRALVHTDELCRNALSQIGVQQSSRWDALTALADLTKNYSQHEYETLAKVIAARRTVDGGSTAREAGEQENMITEAMGRLMAVAEAYPDLKASAVYQNTMDGVKQYEENVRRSRMVFNDTVTKFNRLVRQITGCFIAGPLGFGVREYLAAEESKSDMPSMK